ncbi:hypothetical protein Q5M85_10250 [Paraclostridium bifermentans]|nr:hypothetical protein [Paraclostridium bifermentans]
MVTRVLEEAKHSEGKVKYIIMVRNESVKIYTVKNTARKKKKSCTCITKPLDQNILGYKN